ncbi:MAG: long-chain fatty acid--CoA ligase [Betaproteobacteria bacterium]|nr:long-chain fatty acid--CoA ligase [Betaproteobacteria bacterium]
MNLAATLTQAAAKWPNKEGLVFEGRRWTFAQWNRAANKAAHAFAAHGVKKGDRVAILTWNLPEQVIAFYGLMKIGAVPVPINYRLAANEIKYIVDDSGARLLMFEEVLRDKVAPIAGKLAVEALLYVGDRPQGREMPFDRFIALGAETEPAADVGYDDAAFIMYTSGTTGKPKGVVRTHLQELMGSMIMALECGFRHDDVILNNKPLFHIAQLQLQFLPFVQIGGKNVLTRGFDVHETLSLVGAEKITCLHGVPTQMVMMVQADLSQYDLRSLRCGFFGGQTLADDVTRKCMALFPDYFGNVYGSTEALAVTTCDYRKYPNKLGSVGKAAINMDVRIVNADSGDPNTICKPGEIGQLIARGPSLLKEYFRLPERTAAAFREGWFYSGDAAFTDDEGFITVMGRMDHTIKSGGENIHPSEVENVLFEHPGIANAAAVGLPSKRWGQVVVAAIIKKDPNLDAATLDQFCRDSPNLADFKRPRHYFFVDEIPSNPTGKVERGKLKDRLMVMMKEPLE